MLCQLSIQNIALIDALNLEFTEGLNVLTGETGAGKSIVVDSLSLALGARAGRELLRTGADKASVQALFDVSDCPRAQEMAAELGAPCEDGLLAVSRELSANGRSVCRVSGMVVPLTALKGLTSLLMDIHGQHEHQALLDPEKHLDFLDAYGGEDHLARVRAIGAAYRARMQLAGKIKAALKDAQGRERELAEIERRLAEIMAAKLRPGEEEELESRAAILENAQTGERTALPVDGIFVFLGQSPNNEWFKDAIALDDKGYILAGEDMSTNIPGVFGAGDINHKPYRQITTAVSDGTIAALAAERWLRSRKK